MFGCNTYIITTDEKNAVVIDPCNPSIAKKLNELGLTAQYVLLTHCHFDHTYGVPALQAGGAKVLCNEKEKPLFNTDATVSDLFGAPTPQITIDQTFQNGDELTLCGVTFKVYTTGGHTKGSTTFLVQDGDRNVLFTGDTLFQGSIGRTDFPTGDLSVIRESLRFLKNFSNDHQVFSGHGEETTIGEEKKSNPFLLDV